MSTQWTIILLVVLGLVAAVSAAVLVGFLRVQPVEQAMDQLPAQKDVDVLTLAQDLPSMSRIEPEDITVETVPASNAPDAYLSDPLQAVGKITSVPLIAGQALTRTAFVPEGTGYYLAGNLPEGKRAVATVLAGDSGLVGLLYPGCKVDVLATFRLGGELGTAFSTTMYENVEVIAIGSLTAAAAQKASEEGENKTSGSGSRNLMVTLLVNPVQAKGIQLATDFGNVSLAMRNPTDELPDGSSAQILSESRLARFGDIMTDANTFAEEQRTLDEEVIEDLLAQAGAPETPAPPAPRPEVEAKRNITIDVMRGTVTSTVTFPEASGDL